MSNLCPNQLFDWWWNRSWIEDAQYFVLEALLEYRRHFLAYEADYAIMTNIDFDHPDYYTSIEDVTNAFESFASQTKKRIIAGGDDQLLRQLKAKSVTYYGLEEGNHFLAKNIDKDTTGSSFDVYIDGDLIIDFIFHLLRRSAAQA